MKARRLFYRLKVIVRSIHPRIKVVLLKNAPLGDTPAVEATYPFVGMQIEKKDLCLDPRLSYGVLTDPGIYGVTLTRPDLFKDYYEEQLRLLLKHHKVPLIVGLSTERIPLPFVVDSSTQPLDDDQLWLIHNGFVLPNLSRIDDNTPIGFENDVRHRFFHHARG